MLYYVGIVLTRLLHEAPDSGCNGDPLPSNSGVVHVATLLWRAQLVSETWKPEFLEYQSLDIYGHLNRLTTAPPSPPDHTSSP